MDLRTLKHVVTLARQLNYTKAAEELGITQSALSRSIQAIERRMGGALFDRDRGSVRLAPLGREFATRASSILRETGELEHWMHTATARDSGLPSFGIAHLPAKVLLPALVSNRLGKANSGRCHVFVRGADALVQLLLADEIEFFVCPDGQVPLNASVASSTVGQFPVSLLARAGHPLPNALEPGHLQAYPLLVPNDFLRGAIMPPPLSDFFKGEISIIEDLSALLAIVATTDCIAMASSVAFQDEIRERRVRELAYARPGESLSFNINFVHRRKSSLSPSADAMRDQIKTMIRHLGDSGKRTDNSPSG